MKNGKNPTRKQKIMIKSAGWNPDNWLVTKDTPNEMIIVHRYTNSVKVIRKGA
jgi:hypothetical protein